MAVERTIYLKGDYAHHDEGRADGAITPGMAVSLDADGKYTQVAAAQAEALKGGLKIAKEDALRGGTITTAYAAGDVLFFVSVQEGDHILARVKAGQDIDVGEKLCVEGGGSGLFIAAAGTETKYQLEALEDSGGALGAAAHLKCRVIAP